MPRTPAILDLGFSAFRAALAARPAPTDTRTADELLVDITKQISTHPLPSMTSALGRRREIIGTHQG